MTVKMLSGTVLALMLTVSASEAQKLSQIGSPLNPPPASFKGQQFVDSRGCLFLRAGFGGVVNWVVRVDRSHKPICGLTPTGGSAAQAAVVADMAPDAQARPAAPAQVAAAPQLAAPQPSARAPAYNASNVATPISGVGCYADAPKLEQVEIVGGTVLVCTRGDGTASGWRPPSYDAMPAPAQTAALKAAPVTPTPMQTAPMQTAPMQMVQVAAAQPKAAPQPQPVYTSRTLPKPPKGWTYAWKDDRLNPMRGIGTAEGQAEQDRVWRRTVPMVLVTEKAPPKRWMKRHQAAQPVLAPAPAPAMRTAVATMSAPQGLPVTQTAPQAAGGRMVQIGSFGDPANAQGVMARVSALGLPVSVGRATAKGKTLQTIYAGPFASLTEAQAGLAHLHSAGFADAFLR